MKLSLLFCLTLAASTVAFAPSTNRNAVPSSTTAFSASRRDLLAFGAALALSTAPITIAANALDMDAFENSQIAADQKNCDPKKDPKCIPVLTADEALCKYGQSGNARGEACQRVKAKGGALPSAKPAGKSLGGAYAM